MESQFTGDLEEFKRRFRDTSSWNDLTVLTTTDDMVITSPEFVYTLPKEVDTSSADVSLEFLAIPKRDIPELAAKFVDAMEVEETDRWCACMWRVHPDDLEKPEGSRRKIRIDENEECTIHTKVGMVMGFFAWVFEGENGLKPIIKRGPLDWLRSDFMHVRILDCDGWTRDEWRAQEPITKEEFERRLSECTVQRRPDGN